MAEGEILEEEEGAVTLEEEGAEETQGPLMTNFRGNNLRSLKETDANQKHSCKNGIYIGASTDIPRK